MKGSFTLAEAGAGHDADSGGVEETEAVEVVGRLVGRNRGGDGFGREGDGREEVHCALVWFVRC